MPKIIYFYSFVYLNIRNTSIYNHFNDQVKHGVNIRLLSYANYLSMHYQFIPGILTDSSKIRIWVPAE